MRFTAFFSDTLFHLMRFSLVVTGAIFFLGMSPTAVYGDDVDPPYDPGAEEKKLEEKAPPPPPLSESLPPLVGPKRTISVGKFDAIGAFTEKYGHWDIGGGLSAMLTTELIDSDRFIVVERANIGQVMTEKQMKGVGVTSTATPGGSAVNLGKMTSVQLLIFGSVTEFGPSDQGSGMSLGLSGGGIGSMLGAALSRQCTQGSGAMDIRLVDTITGQILDSFKVTEELKSTGWDLSLGYQGISFGTNEFVKTPLGDATRRALQSAVRAIAEKSQKTSWTGLVVDFDGGEVAINAGSRTGIKVGDKFMIERELKRLTDPATGEVLRIKKEPVGVLVLTDVEEKISFGKFSPIGSTRPQRGDLIQIMK